MTNKKVELLTKVGSKGQIVIRKEFRRALSIKPGIMVTQRLVDDAILIKPIEKDETLKRVNALAKRVAKHWPKELTSVELMKQERE